MAHRQLPGTPLLRACHQSPTHHVEIRQPATDLEPVGILRQPSIPHFGPAEDPLDHQERMLDFGPNLRFGPILRPLLFTQRPMPMGFPLDETLGVWGMLPDHLALSTIGRVAPDPGLLAMQ